MHTCEICEREAAGDEPLGGWVHRDERWSVCVARGFEVPGWLFVELRRHAEGPWGMNDEEAAAFGPLLRRVTRAVADVTGAERVYVLAFGELFPHWHVAVVPRLPDASPDARGTALWDRRAGLVDADRACDTAEQIRAALGGSAG